MFFGNNKAIQKELDEKETRIKELEEALRVSEGKASEFENPNNSIPN